MAASVTWTRRDWWWHGPHYPCSVMPTASDERSRGLPLDTAERRLTEMEREPMLAWCRDTLGPPGRGWRDADARWFCDHRFDRFCFRDEADLAMFVLAFSGPIRA